MVALRFIGGANVATGTECIGLVLRRPYAGAAVRVQIRWKIFLSIGCVFRRDQISALAPFEPRRGIFGAYRGSEISNFHGPLVDSSGLAGLLLLSLLSCRQTFSGPLLGCRHGCLLSTGRSFLRRHGLKASLAAQAAVLLTHRSEVFENFRRHPFRHAFMVHLTPVR